jgi:hypothetical protein
MMKMSDTLSTNLDDKYEAIFQAALSLSMGYNQSQETALSLHLGSLLFKIATLIQGAEHPRDLNMNLVDAAYAVGVCWLEIVDGGSSGTS